MMPYSSRQENKESHNLLKIAAALTAWLIFFLFYFQLTPFLGAETVSLLYIPVLATALLWGMWAGLAVAILALGLTSFLLQQQFHMPLQSLAFNRAFLIHMGILFIGGGFIGYLRDLRERLMDKTQQLSLATQELKYHSNHDPLTGLLNRDAFQAKFKILRRVEEPLFALFLLDLDDFKQINDSFGQTTGNELLRHVAQRLKMHSDKDALLARPGDDEFLLLMPINRQGQAGALALRLLDLFHEPFLIHEQSFFVRASIGISFFPRDGANIDSLIRAADSAMYRVKRRGKSSYESYSRTSHDDLNERFDLEYKLRDALECGELELFYQPQVDVKTEQVYGLEALLRWHHPDLGLLSPDRFIDIAEHAGLIVPIGSWVLAEVCRQQKIWQEAGYGPQRVSVNVSTIQFAHQDFLKTVMQTLEQTGLAPSALELEITESALMKNMATAQRTLRALRDMGVNLAIDDFGVGYSSLSYLQKLPIDTLKIDRSFIPQLDNQGHLAKEDMTLIKAIIGLAHGLEKRVIAEGVDQEAQFEFLREANCEFAQGYYFGEPATPLETKQALTSDWNVKRHPDPIQLII